MSTNNPPTSPEKPKRTPEEQQLHEHRKAQQRTELEEHLAELLRRKGVIPPEIEKD